MKFTTPLIALLAATCAYSHNLQKRDDKDDLMAEFQKTSEEIANQMDAHKDEIDKIVNDMNNMNNASGAIPSNPTTSGSSDASSLASEIAGAAGSAGSAGSDNPFGQAGSLNKENTEFSKECEALIQSYFGCLPKKMNEKNYDQSCDHFNSDECTKLVNKKLTENEACKNASKEIENVVGQAIGVMNLACAKDGNSYCPISKLNKEGKEITKSAIEDSCKSKTCRDKAISAFTYSKQMQDTFNSIMSSFGGKTKRSELKNFDEILAILNDPKCEAQASNALALKMGSSLLLTFAVFLYYFF